MNDKTTTNTTQQATTPPEGNGSAGKMFTQEEVNTIVKDRLARERAKTQTSSVPSENSELDTEKAQIEAERQQLQHERNTFECERFCKEKGIDTKLIELIGSDNPEEFRAKAESLCSLFEQRQNTTAAAATVVMSSGAEHGSSLNSSTEPDGSQYFKPSGTY